MKITVITDTDFKSSGYFSLMMPLCQGLSKLGHDIKIAGLGYKGEEHPWDFSIIPAQDVKECASIIQNLYLVWGSEVLIVAMDIPIQRTFLKLFENRKFKYVGIFPIESDPLSFKWAMAVLQMDKAFCISDFGAKEADKKGAPAENLVIGVDMDSWRIPKEGEREKIRKAFNVSEDAFVVLSISDNQERKNWYAMLHAFNKFAKDKDNVYYVIVTRQDFFAGWDLDELGMDIGIREKLILLDRGMGFKELWGLHAMSDAYMLLSKAEGLSMTTLEAMATGLPVLATNCTAQIEHLKDGRGFLVDYLISDDYSFPPRDPFGLGYRYFANTTQAAEILDGIYDGSLKHDQDAALEYVRSRSWENAINQVDEGLKKL